jgi:hypothetical protein
MYPQKPQKRHILSLIQEELSKPTEIDVEKLARGLSSGANCRAGAVNGTQDSGFISQQLIMLDFDNGETIDGIKTPFPTDKRVTPQQAIDISNQHGLKVAFGYHTHSNNTAEWQYIEKFRLAWVLDTPIYSKAERDKVFDVFTEIYGYMIDSKCRNEARLFYGGHEGKPIYSNYEATNRLDDVLSMWQPRTPQQTPRKATKPRNIKIQPRARNENIEAIRNHDFKFLRKKLGNTKRKIFKNRREMFDYIYRVDIAEILGIDSPKSFCCILHDDNNPSASIFQTQNGIIKYKCHVCHKEGESLNLKQLIEVLGDFKSEYQSLKFIKDILNIDVKKSEWSEEQEQEQNINGIVEKLHDSGVDGFTALCPTASHNTRYAREIFLQMLIKARSTIYPDKTADGNIIFYMSMEEIASKARKSKVDKVRNYVKMLEYHGMIETLEDSQIPKAMLQTARQMAEENHYKRITFYSVPSWVQDRLDEIERNGISWKEHGYRVNGISRELFERTEGEETANRLYKGYTQQATKAEKKKREAWKAQADERHEALTDIIIKQVTEKGWTTEREVLAEVGNTDSMKKQLQRSIADIMDGNNLTKSRLNKALREKYKIELPPESHPIIIYFKG